MTSGRPLPAHRLAGPEAERARRLAARPSGSADALAPGRAKSKVSPWASTRRVFAGRSCPSASTSRANRGAAGGRAMSEHRAVITWKRTGPDFRHGKYSREHTWTFDGGVTVPASSSPAAVPVPYSNPGHVDPADAFVAAIPRCHLLTFLFVAHRQGFQ